MALLAITLAACAESPTPPSVAEPVASLEVVESPDSLFRGASGTLSVRPRDARGRALPERTITWRSTDTAVAVLIATTSRTSTSGQASVGIRARGVGTVRLEARVDSLVTTATLVVRLVPVRAITLSLSAPVPIVGDTATFRVVLRDSALAELESRPVTFTVDPAAVLAISDAGHVTALRTGTATVTASREGVSASMAVAVTGEQVAVVTLDPRALTLGPGAALPVRAWLKDARDGHLQNRPVTYRSSNPAVATIDAQGILRSVAPGVAQITAAAGLGLDSLPVTVLAPTPSAFPITIVYSGTPDTAVTTIVQRAAERWSRVIVGALPPASVTLAAGQCSSGAQAVAVDGHRGVTILVAIDSIDGPGAIAGYGGPCVIRGDGSWLPLVGTVRLDRDDFSRMTGSGLAEAVVLHEIGHVLGIGTLWNIFGYREFVPADGAGVRSAHIGLHTAQASYDLGFSETPSTGAPVETGGGGGTKGAHWSEALLQSEAMTGWVGGASPISAVTVASFRDLGYVVDLAGADGFSVGSTTVAGFPPPPKPLIGGNASLLPVDGPRTPINDRMVLPRWSADRRGRPIPLPSAP